ncbi:hypothetical protein [Streptomyces iconiensis]|uniref:Uncharacterized protein n=1 Tax=Streptomyces iconiensis TaxID=1384038 RepID=A0ABT7A470_9ACTN|nr:hypothetical protein [Streptomyces iconiensis]MDJ1135418.1 hypothetical protein [Streptomyces iconiensis]
MSVHRASPGEPWPGWMTSRAAQAAYGEHLVRIGELIPVLLFMHARDRKDLADAYRDSRPGLDVKLDLLALDSRDDLLETAAVLDALALCHGHGGYLPRPYKEDSRNPVPRDVELRTDASDLAGDLVAHDREHKTSTTGAVPPPLKDGCSDAERDAVRSYARREWIASLEN